MRILWLELPHPTLEYYDAVQGPLTSLGHSVTERSGPYALRDVRPSKVDVVLVGFGWFNTETPKSRKKERPQDMLLPVPAFSSAGGCEAPRCFCGRLPLVVMLNKEYTKLQAKLA